MKLLVCGGRTYTNGALIRLYLTAIHQRRPITRLIHGAQRGADTIAGEWGTAVLGADNVKAYPAHWKHDASCPKRCRRPTGVAAGPVRNKTMLKEEQPDMVLAFPGGIGTASLIGLAHAAKIEVVSVP